MIIFTFFFYSLIVFLLNTKVPHQHNKYYPLVLVFRGIVYFFIALLVILSWRYLKKDSSFEEKEKEAIEELKRKVARFIRD
jgi:phosphotransferase system  glucose/maltose/N-acetylglucosamine-specific IIC component